MITGAGDFGFGIGEERAKVEHDAVAERFAATTVLTKHLDPFFTLSYQIDEFE